MFKLLLLCLLATLVTMSGQEESKQKSTDVTHPASKPNTPKATDAHTDHPTSRPTDAHTDHPTSRVAGAHTVDPTSRVAGAHIGHPTPRAAGAHTVDPTSRVAGAHIDHPHAEHTAPPTVPLNCSCTGKVDCQENECTTKESKRFCVSMAETNNFDGTQNVVKHSCGDNIHLCNMSITITLKENVYWRSHAECCTDANKCNSRSISVPPKDTAPGKVECPSCFVVNETSCKPHHMKCVASETKCIDVVGTVTNGSKTEKFVGKGCATPSAVHIRNGTILRFGDSTYHFIKNIVTDGAGQTPRSVPFIFLLSSFVVLLQAKFIY